MLETSQRHVLLLKIAWSIVSTGNRFLFESKKKKIAIKSLRKYNYERLNIEDIFLILFPLLYVKN